MFKRELLKKLKGSYIAFGQTLGAAFTAPSASQIQIALFVFGVALLSFGLNGNLEAQFGGGVGGGRVHTIDYNDVRLGQSINAVLTYIEGTFGAMVMVAAGIGAILSSAFGQYRAALGLLVVAVGAFILRSLVGTFFNDDNIQG